SDVVTAGKTQCGYRVHDVHDAALIVCSVDDDVARQQQPDVQLGAECLVCERRVAGAENDVRPELYVQLLLQRGAYVDLGEHTEALGRQRLATRSTAASYGMSRGVPKPYVRVMSRIESPRPLVRNVPASP